jgi:hypothetical protein
MSCGTIWSSILRPIQKHDDHVINGISRGNARTYLLVKITSHMLDYADKKIVTVLCKHIIIIIKSLGVWQVARTQTLIVQKYIIQFFFPLIERKAILIM